MKIFLLKNVPKIGKAFDLKRVKPGYARNFLIPKKLAVPANEKNLKWRNKKIKEQEKKNKEAFKKIEEIAKKIKKIEIEISEKAGLKGELFGKVSKKKILKELSVKGINIKEDNILLEKPISKIGKYRIKIRLGRDIESELKLEVKEKKDKKSKKINKKINKKGKQRKENKRKK